MSTTYNLQILCGPLLARPEYLWLRIEWCTWMGSVRPHWHHNYMDKKIFTATKNHIDQQKIMQSIQKSCKCDTKSIKCNKNRSNVTKIDQSDTKSIKVTHNRAKWHKIDQMTQKSIKWHKNHQIWQKSLQNQQKSLQNQQKSIKNHPKIDFWHEIGPNRKISIRARKSIFDPSGTPPNRA